jgi:type II secretion system protein C
MTKQRFFLVAVLGFALCLVAIAVMRYSSLLPHDMQASSLESNIPLPSFASTNNVAKIQQDALFGLPVSSQPKALTQPTIQQRLPKLSVVITGLLVSEGGDSIVTLRHSGLSESLKEGDYLNMAESVRVKRITPTEVVFDRLGNEAVVEVVARKSNEQIVAVRSDGYALYRITDKIQRQFLQSALKEIKASPRMFEHYFHLEKRERGIELTPGKDPRVFTIMPFQRGDQLISVNNQLLSDLTNQDFSELFTAEPVIQIELLRDNHLHNIELVIN